MFQCQTMMQHVRVPLSELPDVKRFQECPSGPVVVPHFRYMGKLFHFWMDGTHEMHGLSKEWRKMSAEERKSLAMLGAGAPMDCRWWCCKSCFCRTSDAALVAEAEGPWIAGRGAAAAVEADEDHPCEIEELDEDPSRYEQHDDSDENLSGEPEAPEAAAPEAAAATPPLKVKPDKFEAWKDVMRETRRLRRQVERKEETYQRQLMKRAPTSEAAGHAPPARRPRGSVG